MLLDNDQACVGLAFLFHVNNDFVLLGYTL